MTKINCPYCGEAFDVEIDHTGGDEQEWTTDCEVCCRPIVVRVHDANGEAGKLDVLQELA